MIKKFFLQINLIMIIVIVLSSCSSHSNNPGTKEIQNTELVVNNENVSDCETVEETEFYKITYSNSMYYYYIFDDSYNTVKSDGPLSRKPHIQIINNHLIRFTSQAGTGIGTQWGFYYDIKKDVFSRAFNSIYDQTDEKVAYRNSNKIIIRDIFDKTNYYQEISSLKKPLANTVDPITNAKFSKDGKNIVITYFAGSDYEEITEIFDI